MIHQAPLPSASHKVLPEAPRLSVGEFFAGIGLARLGFERAGWEVVFANDLDEKKRAMYQAHFGPSPHYHLGDIHDLSAAPEQVPSFTVAHASFPCTDLSLAGGRRGLNAGQSSAFWGFHQLLLNMGDRRPPLVLLENVTGFLTSHRGEDFTAAMVALNELGYTTDAFVIDAAHFVPQSRPRLFVVGLAQEAPIAPHTVELADLEPSDTRPAGLLNAMRQNAGHVNWRLRPLPALPPRASRKLSDVVERVSEDSPQWWDAKRANYLLSQMSDRHRATADEMIAKRRWSYGTVFRRVRHGRSMAELRTDGLAGCLRTPKGGSGRQILFQAGYGRFKVRLLNPNECASLMGAHGYKIHKNTTLNQALFGFGDAVCADAIEWITQHYLSPLADVLNTSSGATEAHEP